MASIYPKDRSPFWYIRYRDGKTGLIVDKSSGFRRDNRDDTRKAKQECAQRTADELEAPMGRSGEGWEWVKSFLKIKYEDSPLTLKRYEAAWFSISAFLQAKRVRSPRQLRREHCFAYFTWRSSDKIKDLGIRPGCHNTALLEIKCLSSVMAEAVIRKLAPSNPCLQLGIGRTKTKQKPAIKPEEMTKIEEALAKPDVDECLQISWAIAIRHGRRLSETCIPLNEVDLSNGTITFKNKGGDMRTKLLHPELVPLFKRLKAIPGRTHTFDMPKNFSKKWGNFFRKIGMEHLSFHSTRVTVVNILRDSGVDIQAAMDFVDHSSVIVHQSYQREKPERQRAAVNALSRNPSF